MDRMEILKLVRAILLAVLLSMSTGARKPNVIIIFQSDHGASKEVRAHGGGGSAGPHRGAKFSLYEGGIRVPALISWPGHLAENAVRDQFATGCDWYPTILDLCGVEQSGHRLDGRSLLPVIKSVDAGSRHEVFHWKSGGAIAVREGKWKLLMQGQKVELYDLPDDLGESRNLAGQHAGVVKRMKDLSATYWRSIAKSRSEK